jgi:hypothetical protein
MVACRNPPSREDQTARIVHPTCHSQPQLERVPYEPTRPFPVRGIREEKSLRFSSSCNRLLAALRSWTYSAADVGVFYLAITSGAE